MLSVSIVDSARSATSVRLRLADVSSLKPLGSETTAMNDNADYQRISIPRVPVPQKGRGKKSQKETEVGVAMIGNVMLGQR